MGRSNMCGVHTVKEILKNYLEFNGFHGLYLDDDCCCFVGNLAPCCKFDIRNCKTGYKQADPDDDDFWMIGSGKEDNPPPSGEKEK